MTKEQIDQMAGGWEINGLVAEIIMGWKRVRVTGLNFDGFGFIDPRKNEAMSAIQDIFTLPKYSIDIAAALEVVDKMADEKWSCLMDCDPDQGVYFKFYWTCYDAPDINGSGDARAKDFPLAICRAALKAVMT